MVIKKKEKNAVREYMTMLYNTVPPYSCVIATCACSSNIDVLCTTSHYFTAMNWCRRDDVQILKINSTGVKIINFFRSFCACPVPRLFPARFRFAFFFPRSRITSNRTSNIIRNERSGGFVIKKKSIETDEREKNKKSI